MWLFGPPNIEKLKKRHDLNGLIKALDYFKDPSVQTAAAVALGEIGDKSAIKSLDSALHTNSTRAAAAEALVRFGAFEELAKTYGYNGYVEVADALVHAGQPSVAPLGNILQNTSHNPDTRLRVLELIKRMGDLSIHWLVAAYMEKEYSYSPNLPYYQGKAESEQKIRRDDAKVRTAIRETLIQMGSKAVEPIIEALQKLPDVNAIQGRAFVDVRQEHYKLIELLSNFGSARVIDALAPYLSDSNYSQDVIVESIVKIVQRGKLLEKSSGLDGNQLKIMTEVMGKYVEIKKRKLAEEQDV